MKPNIILVGGGGHCRSCIDVIEQEGRFDIAGIIDLPEKLDQKILGYPVIGTDDDLPRIAAEYDHFMITLGQIKTPAKRIALFDKIKSLGGNLPVIISPLAYVSKHATVEEGAIVMHNALVNAGAAVGKNCIVNTKALIEHDAVIRDHCHIATNAVINGGCIVGEGVFFGSMSMVRECIEIGSRCVVGAGSKVTKAIANNQTHMDRMMS
jgi:sugar O-acyltransferase (sialic acid O-acetyltransferase NeuD family)